MASKRTWTYASYALMLVGLAVVAAQATAQARQAGLSLILGVVGLTVFLVGLSVGIRYGNHIRYHSKYNQETGAIDASTPYAWVANKLRGSAYRVRGPEPLVHTKRHAFVRGYITLFSVLTFGLTLIDVGFPFYVGAAVSAAGAGIATMMWTQTADEDIHGTQLDELEE